MKGKWFKYVTVVLLAFFFLLAGTGWNLIRFCCAECESAGIEQVAFRSCSCIHRHASSPEDMQAHTADFVCSDLQHHAESCCHLLRLAVDNVLIEHEQHVPPVAEQFTFSDLPEFELPHVLPVVAVPAVAAVPAWPYGELCLLGARLIRHICIWLI